MEQQDHNVAVKCPHCGSANDGAMAVSEDDPRPPEPADVAMCIYCGEFSVLDEDLSLRKPTVMEQMLIDNDPEVRRARMAWRAMKAQQN